MSLFFCLPGHICQKKRYMPHCRRHKGHNAKEWFYMSHCAKKARHNRAKIFYMSPGSPCLLPFFVCHGLLPADMRLVALFAHENFGNLTLCCFWNSFFFVVRRWLFIPTRGASCNVYLARCIHQQMYVVGRASRENNFNVISQCNVFARFQACLLYTSDAADE